MNDVLILGDVKEGALDIRTLELLGAGRKLAGELGVELSVLLMGGAVSEAAKQAVSYGAARVYKMEHPLLAGFKPDLWVASLEQACREIKPKVLLMGHSLMGMELGPRLACRLDTRLTTDCTDLSIDPQDGLLLRTKPVAGGNAVSVFKCQGQPQLATVRGKVFEPVAAVDGKGEIVDIVPAIDESMIKVESLSVVMEETVALDKADVVVAGGAGLEEEEGFDMLRDLAKALSKSFGNVMVGATRVAVDKGWITSDHQVGLTGTMVSPDIFVSVGISGAIQHIVGMIHSKKIITINTDKGCNMFRVSDYGIVEDYKKAIPALIQKLEELA
jgi:electron transfer flavoprotein alpha subunit